MASATANASRSHRMSAAVRSVTSWTRAGSLVNGAVHRSPSLLEPGMFSVTKTTCDSSHITFSTNCASVGFAGSNT